jgi:ribosomal protein S18 acetylase RimI-like enzyme
MRDADIQVRQVTTADVHWAAEVLERDLGGRRQARRGDLIDVLDRDGLVAWREDRRVGLLTSRPDGAGRIELAALVAIQRGTGVGSALVDELIARAEAGGVREIRVTTTNDNVTALAFYQRRGFRLVELRAGAVEASRLGLKPSIAEIADNGIPIRDELELSLPLPRELDGP